METRAGDTTAATVTSGHRGIPWRGARPGSSSARAAGHRTRRSVLVLAIALIVLAVPATFAAYVVRLALSGRDISQTLRLPRWAESRLQRDEIAYPSHVALARGFSLLRTSPTAEGLQWLKAAAHARTDDEIRTIGAGLRSALARSEPGQRQDIAAELCQAARHGSQPGHAMVVALAGLGCQFERTVLGHVTEGQPIYYHNNPPSGGPHYGARYPTYGVVTEVVLPGYWVHNLEHGAVVLLYRCGGPCPELIASLQDFYRTLPPSLNGPNRAPRLLAIPYPDLPAPLAMVAWGESFLLDRFDDAVIRDFYERHVDRGPECRNLRCPE